MASFPISIALDASHVANLMKPVNGEGGFQDLQRRTQKYLHGTTIDIPTFEEAEKVVRYAKEYGEGGFEERFGPIATELRRILNL